MKKSRKIYLDHNATTPVDPRALEVMLPYFSEKFGNPSSSLHVYGWETEEAVEMAREQIDYVYPGNTPQLDNHSYCPACGNLLIERFLYDAIVKGIGQDGCCSRCKHEIVGAFNKVVL